MNKFKRRETAYSTLYYWVLFYYEIMHSNWQKLGSHMSYNFQSKCFISNLLMSSIHLISGPVGAKNGPFPATFSLFSSFQFS